MSELKYYKLFHRASVLTSPEFISVVEFGNGDEVYSKSEADKVIAELEADYKEACDRLQTANLIKDEQLAATRHHKYKRCLDNAWWCRKLINIYAMNAYNHRGWKIEGYFDKKEELYHRWYKRWLELADKFKEAK